MSGRPRGGGRQVMVPPINIIFKTYQMGTRVSIWLYETLGFRIEGQILGFDEYMNLVVKDAVKVATITKNNSEEKREPLGQILLKGDNVSLISNPAA